MQKTGFRQADSYLSSEDGKKKKEHSDLGIAVVFELANVARTRDIQFVEVLQREVCASESDPSGHSNPGM